jgi:hypothetical protein
MAVTTAAVIGIAATVGSTTMSFVQANKQKKAQREAERDADEAMQAAKKKLEVNVYDNLSIQKEAYELEREALLSQGAQSIEAGVESERGVAATAGRVQLAQQEGQGAIRTAMGQELSGLDKLSAQEEGRNRDIGVQLDLEEVAGAQLAAANAAELGAQAEQQVWLNNFQVLLLYLKSLHQPSSFLNCNLIMQKLPKAETLHLNLKMQVVILYHFRKQ